MDLGKSRRLVMVWLIMVVSLCFNFGFAVLLDKPKDTEAVVGSRVEIYCRTSTRYSVNWEHTPVGSRIQEDVFISSVVVGSYGRRVEVQVNKSTGEYHLIIPHVSQKDAGRYECIDEAGTGERGAAELLVFESPPRCQESITPNGTIGDNDCGLAPELVEFQCRLVHWGNLVPKLLWRHTGNGAIAPQITIIERNQNVSTISVAIKPSTDKIWGSYTCETSLSHINWTSSKVEVLYVFNTRLVQKANKMENVSCLANSSHPCDYQWVLTKEDGSQLTTDGSIVIVDSPGLYRCFAKCTIREHQCTVQPVVIEFAKTVIAAYQSKYFGFITASVVSALVLISGATAWLWYRHTIRKRGRLDASSKILTTNELSIQGLAISEKDLYIMHRNSDVFSICLYALDYPYNLRKEIRLKELSDPRDIAVAKNSLLITDAGHSCVWKISFGLWSKTVKFIQLKATKPFTISVNARSYVVLVVQKPDIISLFNQNGDEISPVRIQHAHIRSIDLHHAVQTSDRSFVVSYSFYEEFSEKHEVAKVLSSGHITERYESDLMSGQQYLAINKEDSIYVTDMLHNRMLILNRYFTLTQTVPLFGQSSQPTRVCYRDGQVIVGQSRGAVQVFGVAYLSKLRMIHNHEGSVSDNEANKVDEGRSLLS